MATAHCQHKKELLAITMEKANSSSLKQKACISKGGQLD
jgi:hypothetical protein